jgi:hypothetical protein
MTVLLAAALLAATVAACGSTVVATSNGSSPGAFDVRSETYFLEYGDKTRYTWEVRPLDASRPSSVRVAVVRVDDPSLFEVIVETEAADAGSTEFHSAQDATRVIAVTGSNAAWSVEATKL